LGEVSNTTFFSGITFAEGSFTAVVDDDVVVEGRWITDNSGMFEIAVK